MPDIAVYDSQRAGEQLLFTLQNLEADLTNSVINALTGWDDFYDDILALTSAKDADKREQIRRHALNLKTHVKPAAVAKSGTAQVETATAAGTVSGDGNASVVITAAGMSGSPITLAVPVLNGDTPTVWAEKVRAAMRADSRITALFIVGGATTAITLTRTAKAGNDATLNISLATGTATGITTAATSANTTAGAAQGEAAADAVVAAWSTRADAIAFAQGLAGHSVLPSEYRPSSFTQ